ncbi:MAG: IclR family transcriptional regulator [Oxalobacteraceae bacterium]|nr:IclR family transcriptional regulator [Oxalobacteraceae bacterium]
MTEGKHGVQSLEIGMGLLRAMVAGQRSMMLKDIAAAADMPASKAHRYLVSLIRAGLVEQDPMTSRYNLGSFALNIGLVAIDRLDRVRLGLSAIAELRDAINETTALAVWGETGPVIVRWERPRRPITVNVVTGTALSLLTTASGRVFAAWLPKAFVDPLIANELKTKAPPELKTRGDVETMLENVRAEGVAAISGNYMVKGVEAVAAPVFNFKNEITMALVVVGVEGMINMNPSSPVIAELRRSAKELSLRLGATRAQP